MKKICLVMTGLLAVLIVISLALTLTQKNVPLRHKLALVRIEGPIMVATVVSWFNDEESFHSPFVLSSSKHEFFDALRGGLP